MNASRDLRATPVRGRSSALALTLALFALGGCLRPQPDLQVIASCDGGMWLWRSSQTGQLWVGVAADKDFTTPVARDADMASVCPIAARNASPQGNSGRTK